jgi:hypothetical protein
MSIRLAPTSIRSIRAVSKAPWRVPGNSVRRDDECSVSRSLMDRDHGHAVFTQANTLDRARLCLSCCALKLTDIVTPRGNRTSLAGQCWHCCELHREHSGTGIWPDRDIPTCRRHVTAPRPSLSTAPPPPPRTPAGKARLLDVAGRNPARHGLSAGGRWLRTFSSALDSQRFRGFVRVGADLPTTGHPSSCRRRHTDRVVGGGPGSRHAPSGSEGVTPPPRCRRCKRIAELKVRIFLQRRVRRTWNHELPRITGADRDGYLEYLSLVDLI